VLQTDDRATYN